MASDAQIELANRVGTEWSSSIGYTMFQRHNSEGNIETLKVTLSNVTKSDLKNAGGILIVKEELTDTFRMWIDEDGKGNGHFNGSDEGDDNEDISDDKIWVCHKTDTGYTSIKISQDALQAHLEHGDTQGKCGTHGTGGEHDEEIDFHTLDEVSMKYGYDKDNAKVTYQIQRKLEGGCSDYWKISVYIGHVIDPDLLILYGDTESICWGIPS